MGKNHLKHVLKHEFQVPTSRWFYILVFFSVLTSIEKQYMKHEKTVFDRFSKHREESWERGVFSTNFEIILEMCQERSFVLDILLLEFKRWTSQSSNAHRRMRS